MNQQVKSLVLWVSIALNLAFVGAYGYHRLAGMDPSGGGTASEPRLDDQLGLNPDQQERFARGHAAFLDLLAEVGAEIKQRHLELIDRIAQEPTDREAIHRAQEQIRAQQRHLQAEVVDNLLEEAAVLTPEQRRLYFARIKARIEEARRPAPTWLRDGDERKPSFGGLGRERL